MPGSAGKHRKNNAFRRNEGENQRGFRLINRHMADEPNNKMDEVLKAYAKKRREDAAGPVELHPATRKLLQGEVARVYTNKRPASGFVELLLRFWPRIAA